MRLTPAMTISASFAGGLAVAALLATALGAAATPAPTITYCYIRQTPDGFVALRAGPDASARLVSRMRPGEEVLLEAGRRGVWQQVHLMRRNGRGEDGGFDPASPGGWVHSALIRDCY